MAESVRAVWLHALECCCCCGCSGGEELHAAASCHSHRCSAQQKRIYEAQQQESKLLACQQVHAEQQLEQRLSAQLAEEAAPADRAHSLLQPLCSYHLLTSVLVLFAFLLACTFITRQWQARTWQ
jgi:hypothetical protein